MQRLLSTTRSTLHKTTSTSLHRLPTSSITIPAITQHASSHQQPHRPYTTSPVGGHDFVQSARSLEESHQLVLRLYKKIIRSLPVMIRQFECEGQGIMQASTSNIRSKFEHHSDITDLPILDLLRHKGEIEWEEAYLMHKTKSHFLYSLFGEESLDDELTVPHGLKGEARKNVSKYLKGFYTGKGQEQTRSVL